MSKTEKATREYLQTLTKDRVIELCLQFMFDVEVTEQQLEEKDKEISKLQTSQRDKTQLAIQELEKVKNFVDGRTYCADYINKRIQDLKGE